MRSFSALKAGGLLLALAVTLSPSARAQTPHGYSLANRDTTCAPCKDFYQYSMSGWIAKNPIPSTQPSWSTFNELFEHNRNVLHDILENASYGCKANDN